MLLPMMPPTVIFKSTPIPSTSTQVLVSGLYSTKYIGGFDISKQRRVESDTPGPIQLVPADRQRRALTLVLRVVTGDEPAGGAAFLPGEEDFSNLAAWSGSCAGLGQYCYGVVPVDVLSEVCAERAPAPLGRLVVKSLNLKEVHKSKNFAMKTGVLPRSLSYTK